MKEKKFSHSFPFCPKSPGEGGQNIDGQRGSYEKPRNRVGRAPAGGRQDEGDSYADDDDDDDDEQARLRQWEKEAWREAKSIVNQSRKRWEVSHVANSREVSWCCCCCCYCGCGCCWCLLLLLLWFWLLWLLLLFNTVDLMCANEILEFYHNWDIAWIRGNIRRSSEIKGSLNSLIMIS